MDDFVQIVGLAGKLLMAGGVPPWAFYAACLVLAFVIILAPKAWPAIRAAILHLKVEPTPKQNEVSDGGAPGPGVKLHTDSASPPPPSDG